MTTIFGMLFAPQDWIVIAIVGILLFGRKLPEVGRYLGKGIIEFKKGMKGLEDDMDGGFTGSSPPPSQPQQYPQQQEPPRPPQRITNSAPKFDDPSNPSAPPRI